MLSGLHRSGRQWSRFNRFRCGQVQSSDSQMELDRFNIMRGRRSGANNEPIVEKCAVAIQVHYFPGGIKAFRKRRGPMVCSN